MPTTPPKKHFTYTIRDFYKIYKKYEKDKGIAVKDIISEKEYREIMEDFFERIMKKIIYDNFTFMLPYSLGSVLVKAFKTNLNNLQIDWSRSEEVGKMVKHLNLHTFGYYFGIVWDKSYVRFKNNAYYKFCATSSKKATKLGIGKKALSDHIRKLSRDPEKRSYIKI
jgi:hypothetical protein